jgi:hypothetical protein
MAPLGKNAETRIGGLSLAAGGKYSTKNTGKM